MIEENDRLREWLGVTAWHEAGFTGRGVTAASGEQLSTDETEHGWQTAAVFREIAPEAALVSLPWEGMEGDAFGQAITEGIKEHGASVWWASIASGVHLTQAAETRFAKAAARCVLFMAGGNQNSQRTVCRSIESPSILGVNACTLTTDGRVLAAYYNFPSAHIDYCAPDGWWLPSGARFVGTSAAAPALAGMAALVQQMAMEQIGRVLSSTEMCAFFSSCAKAVGATCGAGCPVLPKPESVHLQTFVCESEGDHVENSGVDNVLSNDAGNAGVNLQTLTITEHDWRWAHALTPRAATDGIVLHHAAGNGTAEAIHATHLKNGWAGIGYHYYVRKDGSVHRGRPEWAAGAHVRNENSHLLGICFEGNFEQEQMCAAQQTAGVLLLRDVLTRYPVSITQHKAWGSTACPGKNFPFAAMVTAAQTDEKESEDDMVYYQTQADIPAWGSDTISKLVDAGALQGDGDGNLNISKDMLRTLVILDRLGKL